LLRFGLPLTGANLIGYTIGNVDVGTIGRMAGPVPLGTFSLASNVAGWPLSLFSTVLVNVGLPVLSKVRHDAVMLTRYLTNAMSAISFASLYVAAMCASLAQPLVVSLYGQKWAAAGGVLAVLGIYGAVRVFLALVFDALVACNATSRLLATQLLWIVVLVPAMITGVATGGVEGAAVAHVLVSALVVFPLSLIMLRRAAGVRLQPLLAGTVLPISAAVLTALAARAAAGTVDNSWAQVGLGAAVGTAVYVVLTWRGGRRVLQEIRSLYGSGPASSPAESEADVTDYLSDRSQDLSAPASTIGPPAPAAPRQPT
jgi:PST family polysaccharide transporter